MNFIASILLFCEGPENSLLLLNHSGQKENQSQLGRTFRVTSTFFLIDRYNYLNDDFREIN